MRESMNKIKNVLVLKSGEWVMLYNLMNGVTMRINSAVYSIIKDIKCAEDIDHIIGDYSQDDQQFLMILKNRIIESDLFNKVTVDKKLKISYVVTEECNLECTHCCRDASRVSKESNAGNRIDINILDKIVELKPTQIVITGGEPLTTNNFKEAISHLRKKYDGIITLATNATLINEKNISALLENVDNYDISIDGYNEETCDKIRGVNAYKRIMKAVALLKENGVKNITLSMVVDDDTYSSAHLFKDMCEQLEVEPIVRKMNPVGRAARNHIGSDNICAFADIMVGNVGIGQSCKAGREELAIDKEGNIYPCVNFMEEEFCMGNLFEKEGTLFYRWDMKDTWFKRFSRYLSNYRKECAQCEINPFCWTCPASVRVFLDQTSEICMLEQCEKKRMRLKEVIENV